MVGEKGVHPLSPAVGYEPVRGCRGDPGGKGRVGGKGRAPFPSGSGPNQPTKH